MSNQPGVPFLYQVEAGGNNSTPLSYVMQGGVLVATLGALEDENGTWQEAYPWNTETQTQPFGPGATQITLSTQAMILTTALNLTLVFDGPLDLSGPLPLDRLALPDCALQLYVYDVQTPSYPVLNVKQEVWSLERRKHPLLSRFEGQV